MINQTQKCRGAPTLLLMKAGGAPRNVNTIPVMTQHVDPSGRVNLVCSSGTLMFKKAPWRRPRALSGHAMAVPTPRVVAPTPPVAPSASSCPSFRPSLGDQMASSPSQPKAKHSSAPLGRAVEPHKRSLGSMMEQLIDSRPQNSAPTARPTRPAARPQRACEDVVATSPPTASFADFPTSIHWPRGGVYPTAMPTVIAGRDAEQENSSTL